MTRTFHDFMCEGAKLAGTLDSGEETTGLLIVSGGNEIRAGAHGGMARLSETISGSGYPVFRYDRRGIGDSDGKNEEFESAQSDYIAAIQQFRSICPDVTRILAFGNCDAATSIAMFQTVANVDMLVLANPWVYETAESADDNPSAPPPSAIRARYWNRLKNLRTILDLLGGKINFRKLMKGLVQATQKQDNSLLAIKLRDVLANVETNCEILISSRDTTARTFVGAWQSSDFASARANDHVKLHMLDSASHSFADQESKAWLEKRLLEALKTL